MSRVYEVLFAEHVKLGPPYIQRDDPKVGPEDKAPRPAIIEAAGLERAIGSYSDD